jgi:glycosyltransferase involved in cell wall biosynthesis
MNRTSIAVVIPTFNRAELLRRAIQSVFAQRRLPDEVIVVDDGSSDHTREVVEADAREILFIRKDNGGVSSARNAGVRRSTTDFVAFLDSDDYWYEEHLDRMERAILASGGRAGLYFSDQQLAPSRGTTAWQRADFSIDDSRVLMGHGRVWAFLSKQPMTINASVARRDAYLAVGGCDERLACREDTHLFFKLGLSTPLCAVAGHAGMLTADDETSLSRRDTTTDFTYLNCTVLLYEDILRTFGESLTVEEKQLVSGRLAAAHWSIARSLGSGSPRRMLAHIAHVVANDPTLLPRSVARRARASLTRSSQTS